MNPSPPPKRSAAHALIGAAGSSPKAAVDLLREDRRIQREAEDADARRRPSTDG